MIMHMHSQLALQELYTSKAFTYWKYRLTQLTIPNTLSPLKHVSCILFYFFHTYTASILYIRIYITKKSIA